MVFLGEKRRKEKQLLPDFCRLTVDTVSLAGWRGRVRKIPNAAAVYQSECTSPANRFNISKQSATFCTSKTHIVTSSGTNRHTEREAMDGCKSILAQCFLLNAQFNQD